MKESDWSIRSYGSRWLMRDELSFIKGLGYHTDTKKELMSSDRIALLKGYLRSMDVRTNWGELDPQKIKVHVTLLIQGYEAISNRKDKNAQH